MIGLKISYSDDWNEYTDEEILMLPFDLPRLLGEEACKSFGSRVRPSLFPLRIFLLRDLLTFSRNRRPRFQFLPLDRSKLLLQQRFRAFPPASGVPEFKGNRGPYKNAMSAIVLLRNTLWKHLDQKVKDRLERMETLPESLKPMQAPGRPFMPTRIYDLILWHKLTLANVLCKDYTVRRGRMAALGPKLLRPSWEDIRGGGET
jgi:hypothetical protein